MASIILFIRTASKSPDAKVNIRVKVNAYYGSNLITAHAQSGVIIPRKVWDDSKKCVKSLYIKGDETYKRAKENLDKIYEIINTKLLSITTKNGKSLTKMISSEWLNDVIGEYWSGIELAQKRSLESKEAEAAKPTLNQFIKRYLKEISDGKRLTAGGTIYEKGTVKSIRHSMIVLSEFEKATKRKIDFNHINPTFYAEYGVWLATKKDYTPSTIINCIKDLRSIMSRAMDEELHDNSKYLLRSFKKRTDDVKNIYLTQAELDAMEALDFSDQIDGMATARDIFLLGCCLAQRVSDYTKIKSEDISTIIQREIVEDQIVSQTLDCVAITQKKGSKRVVVLLNSMAKRILSKYDNKLPKITEQHLNRCIKEVAYLAGITTIVNREYVKGGVKRCEQVEKYKLVTSHTASHCEIRYCLVVS